MRKTIRNARQNHLDWLEQVVWYQIPEPEITDADIEAWAEKVIMNYLTDNNSDGDFKRSTIGADDKKIWWQIGAKAMRDGLIKHIEK